MHVNYYKQVMITSLTFATIAAITAGLILVSNLKRLSRLPLHNTENNLKPLLKYSIASLILVKVIQDLRNYSMNVL